MGGFLGFLLVCSFIAVFVMSSDDEVGIFVGIMLSVLLIPLWALYLWLRPTKEDKQRMKQAEEKNQIKLKSAFYDECVKNGIKTCDNAKEIQKATLIAQSMGFTFTDVTTLFAESKQCKKNIEYEKKDIERENKRKEEIQKHALLTQYADYTGREKRIAMLSDERKKYIEAAETLRSGASALLLASQFKEKEGDWAIMGGAASALAGPAAGVAAALNAQAKTAQENAQIRAQNQRNRELFSPVAAISYSGAAQKEAAAKQLEEEIEATKMKLVADDSPSDCFARLHFDNTKVSISRTGTCTVKTIISVDPFMIFDDIPAVIDGTIFAEIYDGDQLLGTAQMVLPVDGIKTVKQLTGMALFCGRVGGSYRIEFSPRCLWAMEE